MLMAHQACRPKNPSMRRIILLALLVLMASYATAAAVYVNCDAQQSLNRTLSVLPKQIPITVWVKGTCSEYVNVIDFNGLTLKGFPGAKLREHRCAVAQPDVGRRVVGGNCCL